MQKTSRSQSFLERKSSLKDSRSHRASLITDLSRKDQYSAADLEEVIDRTLKGDNPNVTSTPVYFDYKKNVRSFKFIPTVDHMAMHLSLDGNSILKKSEEAHQLAEDHKRRWEEFERATEAEKNPMAFEEGTVSTSILKNQFNYSERASQTINEYMKTARVITDPPPRITFAGAATAWEIYDAYEEDYLMNERISAAAVGRKGAKESGEGGLPLRGSEPKLTAITEEVMSSLSLLAALTIMERMVHQNDCADIIDDFKYWEDQSDMYKEDGNLLPLWKFQSDKVKRRVITSIVWNPRYNDLFAVGYGSYDFQKQGPGNILCFTLKNGYPSNTQGQQLPAFPEFMFTFDCGVMCLEFHPTEASILAVGLYDGRVCVFDLQQPNADKRSKPLFQSSIKAGKHTDPVWQIRWSKLPGIMQFFTISTDGRVTAWTIAKNELTYSDIIKLTMTDTVSCSEEADAALIGLCGGMCFDFSPVNENIFIVGTQEGLLRRCCKTYTAHYLDTYDGHSMAVYAVQWNPFHADIFISCSADWTVKVWIKSSNRPLMTFDLGDAVGDVMWSPYSSTVFAAVTTSGKALVFDLNKNKNEALCSQAVVKNAKLNHIVFNPKDPIVLVGDSRGTVLSLKLSPNLRQVCKPGKGQPSDSESIRKMEVEKLNRIVEIILKDRELLDA